MAPLQEELGRGSQGVAKLAKDLSGFSVVVFVGPA